MLLNIIKKILEYNILFLKLLSPSIITSYLSYSYLNKNKTYDYLNNKNNAYSVYFYYLSSCS